MDVRLLEGIGLQPIPTHIPTSNLTLLTSQSSGKDRLFSSFMKGRSVPMEKSPSKEPNAWRIDQNQGIGTPGCVRQARAQELLGLAVLIAIICHPDTGHQEITFSFCRNNRVGFNKDFGTSEANLNHRKGIMSALICSKASQGQSHGTMNKS